MNYCQRVMHYNCRSIGSMKIHNATDIFRKAAFILIGISLLIPGVCGAGEASFLRPDNYAGFYDQLPDLSGVETISLNGNWKYRIEESGQQGRVEIPSSFEGKGGKITFSRSFALDDTLSEKRIFLTAYGVFHRCRIWLNDEIVTTADGPRIKAELPKNLLKTGKNNRLEIEVDNSLHPTNTIPLKNGFSRPLNYGGLTGDIFLEIGDAVGIDRLKIDAFHDRDNSRGYLIYSFKIDVPPLEDIEGTYTVELMDKRGKRVFSAETSFGENPLQSGQIAIENPESWQLKTPYLYTLKIQLNPNKGSSAQISRKIGFRSIEAGDDIYLNGGRIKLKGVSYHPVNSFGKTLTASDFQRDLHLILESGANCVLMPEPAHPYFYHLCDSLGVLIFQSTSLDGVPRKLLKDPSFSESAASHWNEITETLSGHPSIIAWIAARDVNLQEETVSDYSLFRTTDSRPVFLETNSIPKQLLLIGDGRGAGSKLYCVTDLGVFQYGDDKEYETLRTEKLLNLLSGYKSADAVFLKSFFDFSANRSLLFINPEHKSGLYGAGVADLNRNPRNVFRHLRESWYETPPSIPVDRNSSSPILFPIAGFVIIALFLMYYRANKLFRIQLRRVFAHNHGFLVDIRNGRYVQMSHSIMITLLTAPVISLLISGTLHYDRFSHHLDFVLAHLIPSASIHSYVLHSIWNPLNSLLHILFMYIAAVFALAVFFRINTFILRSKTNFRRTFIMTQWSLAPVLLLSPLTIIYYRVLSLAAVKYLMAFIIAVVLVWTVFRLLFAIKIASSSNGLKTALTFTTLNAIIIAGIVSILQHNTALLTYWEYIMP